MFERIDLQKYTKYEREILAAFIIANVFIAFYVNVYLGIDIVYTQLFYLPIILAGLWYHRKALYVALFLGLLHICLDYYVLGVISHNAVIRAVIFIAVALVVGTLSEVKDSLNARLEESNKKLSESHQRLSNVIEFYPDATLIIDKDGRVTTWNKAMEELTGVKASDMIGQVGYAHSVPFYGKKQPMLLDRLSATDEELNGMYERVDRRNGSVEAIAKVSLGGRDRVLRVTASRLYDGDDMVAGAIESLNDVTAEWQAEEALQKAHDELERRVSERTTELEHAKITLQAILNTIQVGVVVVEAGSGHVTYFTRGAAEILNGPIESVDDSGISGQFQLFNQDGSPMRPEERLLSSSLRNGVSLTNREILVRRGDGKELTILASSAPIKDVNGRISAAVASFIDISELNRAVEALRESREKYRTLIENINDLVWEADGNMVYTYASPQVKNVLGYTPKEVVGKTPYDFMYPDDSKRFSKTMEQIKASGKPFSFVEIAMIDNAGGHVIFEMSGSPIFDEKGVIAGFRGVNRNVTGRKNAEKALMKSEVRSRALISAVPNTVLWINKDGTFIDYKSERESDMFLPPDELIGRNIYEALPIDLARTIGSHVDNALKYGGIELFDYRVNIKGNMHNQRARCVASGKDEVLMVIRDLTDQIHLEQSLEKAYEERDKLVEERTARVTAELDSLHSILDSLSTGVIVVEAGSGRIAYFNKGAVEIFGGPIKSLTKGRQPYKLMLPDGGSYSEDALPVTRSLRYGERVSNVEMRIKRYDGLIITALFSSAPVLDGEGKIAAAVATITDITH